MEYKKVIYKSYEWAELVKAKWVTVEVIGQGHTNPIAVMQPPKNLVTAKDLNDYYNATGAPMSW